MVQKSCEIGIIGGSGIYSPGMLEHLEEFKMSTPFGSPSDLISVGSLSGRKVAFIPRHGREHQWPPHRVPYRANIWALKELGVKRLISASAVGSLREDYRPSELVLIDQFIDRTKWRDDTFYEGGRVCHISTADPFCPELRGVFIRAANHLGIPMHEKGTYICIQGPRFSTRAESRLFRSWGVDVIGMTLCPEVMLAREAELCYISVTMITDYDVWAEKPVSAEEVQRTMAKNIESFTRLIVSAIPQIPTKRSCECGSALSSALV
ncbi:MAG: S-methyl-5'-thioadenosine phosphorylase [Candidatus Bathyarchaeia archaeon]